MGEEQILCKGNSDGKKKKQTRKSCCLWGFPGRGKKVCFPLKEYKGKMFDPFHVLLALPLHSLTVLSIM